jgi:hypothetical protein
MQILRFKTYFKTYTHEKTYSDFNAIPLDIKYTSGFDSAKFN